MSFRKTRLKVHRGGNQRAESGATLVEFTLLALPFLILTFGIVEIAMYAMHSYILHTALYRTARVLAVNRPVGACAAGQSQCIFNHYLQIFGYSGVDAKFSSCVATSGELASRCSINAATPGVALSSPGNLMLYVASKRRPTIFGFFPNTVTQYVLYRNEIFS